MDVTQNRDIDKVIVLGSGESILSLNQEEISYINRCRVVISVNKFMAFYKKSGIIPTHVYFVDTDFNNLLFIKYIHQLCEKDNLEGLTFIFHKSLLVRVYNSILRKRLNQSVIFIYFGLRFLRRFRKAFLREMINPKKYLKINNNYNYQFITHTLSTEGKVWQKSINKKLFHFRGSLTTVLNYISILYPNKEIYLVGADFYGASYFFEKELDQLGFNWKDNTYDIVKAGKKHFSFQEFKGVKMTDKFPFIMKCLEESGNRLFCINKESLLVKEANVEYKDLMGDDK